MIEITLLRSRPIEAKYCQTADTCSDKVIHVVVVSRAVKAVTLRRAEVLEYRLVVALLRHGPVRHGGLAQLGVARQAAASGIIRQHFQRSAGVSGYGGPAVDGFPFLLRSVLQGENQTVTGLRHLAQNAHCGTSAGYSSLSVVQMACGAHHLAIVLSRSLSQRGRRRRRLNRSRHALHLQASGVLDGDGRTLGSGVGADGPLVGILHAVLHRNFVGVLCPRARRRRHQQREQK